MTNKIARIENTFIENAQYRLGVREQKVILYLMANTDPTKEDFIEHVIPVKELETILKSDGRKWGGIYKELNDFCDTVTDRKISFPESITLNGKPLKGYINWFQSVRPVETDDGDICIRFLFSSDLKPFLLKLREYAQINRLEVANMRRSYSIRLFQIFKALREKQRKHKNVVTTTYGVNELKKLLGLYDPKKDKYKYPSFGDFNRYVLAPAEKEINEQTSIYVEIFPTRNGGRRITDIRFNIYDQDKNKQSLTNEKKQNILKKMLGENRYDTVDLKLFKRTFPKDYLAIEKEVHQEMEQFKKDSNADALPNEKKMIENHIKSKCLEKIREKLEIPI